MPLDIGASTHVFFRPVDTSWVTLSRWPSSCFQDLFLAPNLVWVDLGAEVIVSNLPECEQKTSTTLITIETIKIEAVVISEKHLTVHAIK